MVKKFGVTWTNDVPDKYLTVKDTEKECHAWVDGYIQATNRCNRTGTPELTVRDFEVVEVWVKHWSQG